MAQLEVKHLTDGYAVIEPNGLVSEDLVHVRGIETFHEADAKREEYQMEEDLAAEVEDRVDVLIEALANEFDVEPSKVRQVIVDYLE